MKSKWKILSRIEEIYFWSLENRKNGYLHKSHLHPRLHDHIDNNYKFIKQTDHAYWIESSFKNISNMDNYLYMQSPYSSIFMRFYFLIEFLQEYIFSWISIFSAVTTLLSFDCDIYLWMFVQFMRRLI